MVEQRLAELGPHYFGSAASQWWSAIAQFRPLEALDAIEWQQAFVARYLRQSVDATEEWTSSRLEGFVTRTLDLLKAEKPKEGGPDLARMAEDEWM